MMNPDGTGRKNPTNSGTSDIDPEWSPDGSKIAFASRREFRKYEIYSMNRDGTGVTNLTNSRYVAEEEPAYSPDGTKIAFMRFVNSEVDPDIEIFVKNADGTGKNKNVTNTPHLDEHDPDWGLRPAPSG
jgi:Tol biopolymer transport system component